MTDYLWQVKKTIAEPKNSGHTKRFFCNIIKNYNPGEIALLYVLNFPPHFHE